MVRFAMFLYSSSVDKNSIKLRVKFKEVNCGPTFTHYNQNQSAEFEESDRSQEQVNQSYTRYRNAKNRSKWDRSMMLKSHND